MPPETPEQWREHVLKELRTLAEASLGDPWVSLTLCVAQYWDDEAHDAVHQLVVGSLEPLGWPHACYEDETTAQVCSECGGVPDIPRWSDNGWAIAAFAPWCKEGADQGRDVAENYLPVAVARRDDAGAVAVTWIGEPQRPWLLDAPEVVPAAPEIDALLQRVYTDPERDDARLVLADILLERREPRGAFIAAQLAGREDEARALLAGNAAAWSGDLAAVTAPPRTVFRRGFPAEVYAHFRDDAAVEAFGEAPAWGTVERLHWTDGSAIHYPDTLRALRAVKRQPEASLWALCGSRCFSQLEDLEVVLDAHQDLAGLAHATSLRSLQLGPVNAGRSLFEAPIPWAQLTSLYLYVQPSDGEEGLLEYAVQQGISAIVLESAGLRLELQLGVRAHLGHGRGWVPDREREQLVTRLGQWLRRRSEPVELDFRGGQAPRLVAAFGG